MIDTKTLLAPVNLLVTDPAAPNLYSAMMKVSELPPEIQVELTGEAASLNALLDLFRRDREAFWSVVDLIDRKREARGWPPLRKKEAPKGFDKVEYQRMFMDQKRQRERRAAAIENMLRPERERLIGNPRLEFMRVQSGRWRKLRDSMVNAAREANGGHLSKEATQAILAQFWEKVDRELDLKEEDARRAGLK